MILAKTLTLRLECTVLLAAAITVIAAMQISFQQGVDGYSGTIDTYLAEAEAATGHGANQSFGWDTDDPTGTYKYNYALIRFDDIVGTGAGRIPEGALILSATLTYSVFNSGDQAEVNEVSVTWSENATWNNFGGDAGVDMDEYGGSVATANGNSIGSFSIDITSSVAAWVLDPAANQGWLFRPTGSNGVDIRSREYSAVDNRPTLTVDYDPTPTLPPYPPVLIGPDDDAAVTSIAPVLVMMGT
jgi:hypothetical protein